MTSRLIEWQLSSMKVKYNQYKTNDSSVCGVLPVWLLYTYYNKSNMLVTWHLVIFVAYSIHVSIVTYPHVLYFISHRVDYWRKYSIIKYSKKSITIKQNLSSTVLSLSKMIRPFLGWSTPFYFYFYITFQYFLTYIKYEQ